VASKSAQHEPEKAEVIEELLDHCDTTLDRVKVLYEQFFLGIQKQPPTHLHTDVERKLRELQQLQIRNTALRYRFATIQQKFGSYNSYWRRTLRQIENGTYHRNLAKIGRQAAQTGEEIPDEILAAMPKRMREQVKRDREAALALKRRRDGTHEGTHEDADFLEEQDTQVGKKTSTGAHVLEDDGDFDLDAYFRAVTNEDGADQTTPDMPAITAPPPRPAPAPVRAAARPPTFEGEVPTQSDLDPPTDRPAQIVSRPAPITNSPIQHASAAVRAAVGMRTPPAGLPRVSPPGLPQQTQPIGSMNRTSGGFPAINTQTGHASGQHPAGQHAPGSLPSPPGPVPSPSSGGLPPVPPPPGHRPGLAPSQVSRPLPVMPGASNTRAPVAVESMSGPFAREQPSPAATTPGMAPMRSSTSPDATTPGMSAARPTPDATSPGMPAARPPGPHPGARTAPGMGPQRPSTPGQPTGQIPRPSTPGQQPPRPGPPPAPGAPASGAPPRPAQPFKPRITTEPGVAPPARVGPPPGMTDADVNALYAKYVKAKEAVGEKAGPGSYGKLLQTINAQAPKIMEQYKARGVDFQVVVKDNQVVIRAKPKP
jgi:hypothetical protein